MLCRPRCDRKAYLLQSLEGSRVFSPPVRDEVATWAAGEATYVLLASLRSITSVQRAAWNKLNGTTPQLPQLCVAHASVFMLHVRVVDPTAHT